MQDFISSESNFTRDHETGNRLQITDTYTISGTLCTPKQGAKNPDHVQLLVHGVGFDSRCVFASVVSPAPSSASETGRWRVMADTFGAGCCSWY